MNYTLQFSNFFMQIIFDFRLNTSLKIWTTRSYRKINLFWYIWSTTITMKHSIYDWFVHKCALECISSKTARELQGFNKANAANIYIEVVGQKSVSDVHCQSNSDRHRRLKTSAYNFCFGLAWLVRPLWMDLNKWINGDCGMSSSVEFAEELILPSKSKSIAEKLSRTSSKVSSKQKKENSKHRQKI